VVLLDFDHHAGELESSEGRTILSWVKKRCPRGGGRLKGRDGN
jgi:hypothetical protein